MSCHNTQSHNLFILVILTLVSFSSLPAWSQPITTVDLIHDLTMEDLHSSKELTVELFHDWMEKHDKVYDNTNEMLMRYEHFKDSVHDVVEINSMTRMGKTRTKHLSGLNAFSDMPHQEFIEKYASCDKDDDDDPTAPIEHKHISCPNAPSSWNWTKQGGVNPVKDQFRCGSCWAFSVVGALEWIYWNETGKLETLSEQQLVECDSTNHGCCGGKTHRAYKWVMENGIVSSETYPYEARMKYCQLLLKGQTEVTIDDYRRVDQSDRDLRCAVAKQPISVSINAHAKDFKHYKHGIYDGHCASNKTTHAVLLVGYGSENNEDYWIVKNSWGTSWGENGYARIKMDLDSISPDDNGTCAIHSKAYYPIKKKDDGGQLFGATTKHGDGHGFKTEL